MADVATGATPWGGPMIFDSREKGGYGDNDSFAAVVHAMAGTDRSDIRAEVRSNRHALDSRFEGLETRQKLAEVENTRKQDALMECIHGVSAKVTSELTAFRLSALERENAELRQRMLCGVTCPEPVTRKA